MYVKENRVCGNINYPLRALSELLKEKKKKINNILKCWFKKSFQYLFRSEENISVVIFFSAPLGFLKMYSCLLNRGNGFEDSYS